MLSDYHTGVDTDDIEAGEGERDGLTGNGVEVGLIVSGNKNGTIEDDEIGVGGRQPFTVIENGVGHR